jgi:hypothetical protein
MTHTTLRERMEKREKVRRVIREAGQIVGYTIAGMSISVMTYAFMVSLLAR